MKSIFLTYRRPFIVALDAVFAGICFFSAFLLRFDGVLPPQYWDVVLKTLPLAVGIKLAVFAFYRQHQVLWRYTSTGDLVRILKANTIGALLLTVAIAFIYHFDNFPRSIIPLDWALSILVFGGKRFAVRILLENTLRRRRQPGAVKRLLIAGAGSAGVLALREMSNNRQLTQEVIGFLDDDKNKHNMTINGIEVLGSLSKAPKFIHRHKIDEILIAMPTVPKHTIRNFVEACSPTGVKFSIMPAIADLITGKLEVQRIRNVQLEDLLGRELVKLDRERVRNDLYNQPVLITGAGGSIGSEICRQVAACRPSSLVLLDVAETPLFHIEQEIIKNFPEINVYAALADIRIVEDLSPVFEKYSPKFVFHAAAYKHVPLLETHPLEAVLNNVFGTRNVAVTAKKYGVKRFVMISTDKAVRPSSVMGATKRCAEILVQGLNGDGTDFMVVRFGNVLGSNGSVVPIFKRQIEAGGPVTVTHPDITRYFMTIPEAVELVLQAGTIGRGGDSFLLEMGDPVKIVDLARDLIELSGLVPDEDIKIEFTGLRPGEKMHEELVAFGEAVQDTGVPKLKVHHRALQEAWNLADDLKALERMVNQRDRVKVRNAIWNIVRKYDKDCIVAETDKKFAADAASSGLETADFKESDLTASSIKCPPLDLL